MSPMSSTPGASDNLPPPSRRRWVGLFIAGFLLWQLVLPLRYYLNVPTTDERFAWRMFSSVRMRDCEAKMFEVVEKGGRRLERPVPPAALLLWQKSLSRDKPDVVEKTMRWWCSRPGVVAVRYEQRCRTPDGRVLEPKVLWLDRQSGQVRGERPTP